LQKEWANDPVQSYNNQTYWIVEREDGLYATISYMPRNTIEVRLELTERDESLIKDALNGRYKLGGALLLKRDEWEMRIAIEKMVSLPKWQNCETIVGVDIGIRSLASVTVLKMLKKKFYREKLNIKVNIGVISYALTMEN
jgi:transposase